MPPSEMSREDCRGETGGAGANDSDVSDVAPAKAIETQT
jgi:hypothetical protein